MAYKLRVDVASVTREMEAAMRVLTEARVVSRYRKVFKGKGIEFEDFREYTTDDDASRIDWRASKRANRLLIRQFREERDMNVFFMVDVSTSMMFGSSEKLKHEYAAALTAALAHFILQSGDRIGLVLFSDKVVKYVGPGKSNEHFYMMLRSLLTPECYGGGCNLSAALKYLMNTISEKSLVFIISDFIGLGRGWEIAVKQASGRFDGVGVMVKDPRDMKLLPEAGQVFISDPFSGRQMLVDCGNRERRAEYEAYNARRRQMVIDVMRSVRWDFVEVETDKGFVLPIIKFLKRREILFR